MSSTCGLHLGTCEKVCLGVLFLLCAIGLWGRETRVAYFVCF